MEQWSARLPVTQKVVGSSPIRGVPERELIRGKFSEWVTWKKLKKFNNYMDVRAMTTKRSFNGRFVNNNVSVKI